MAMAHALMRARAVRRDGAGRPPPRAATCCLVLSLYVLYVDRVDVRDCMARLRDHERSTLRVDRSVALPGYF